MERELPAMKKGTDGGSLTYTNKICMEVPEECHKKGRGGGGGKI